ncbi:uncharacterized protein LOC127640016 isoform X2 [Xyrauchen texanus]|uniref:uncharacterized protein LOC127640016 isoform X1 n=1 Tax=Xyrauchen texanus TaxID=154827 RepID=UPI0022424C8F|nr:uncharacterized protein LOC127640016 isoform X1 [Xyrauchen texanus]XP_051978352.1 uncharacterized protein LOC127640016 isoform X2 [Xyrauchen texanus]
MKYCWSLLALQLFIVNGVFGVDTDEIKSVIEGDSVTLDTNVEKLESDLIGWYFGPEGTRLAQINGKADSMRVYDDVLDGRFKGRLELNSKTGSLTIRDITTEHSGLYTLRITSNKVSYTTFSLTVNEKKSETDYINVINEIDEIGVSTPGRSRSVSFTILYTVFMSAVLIVIISAVICFRKHRVKGLIKVQTSETDVLTEERRHEDKNQQQV